MLISMRPIPNTLYSKISQMLVLMVGVILLFSFSLFQSMKTTYDKLYYQKFKETLTIAVTYIEYELDKISEMTLYLSTDGIFQSYLYELNQGSFDYEKSQIRDKIQNILFKQAYGETYLSQIEILLPEQDTITVGRDAGSYASAYRPFMKKLDGYEEGRDSFLMAPNGFIMNVRNIRSIASLDFFSLGTMIVYINVGRLIQKFQRQIPYYLDLNLAIIKDDTLLTNDPLSERIMKEVVDIEEGYALKKIDDHSYFITLVPGKREGWRYMGYVSLEPIDNINRQIWISLTISHILMALVLIFAGRLYVKRFTLPLEDLSHELRAFELNDFTISLKPPQTRAITDEIGDLYKDVDLALQKIQSQVYENYTKQMSLQKTQLQMLQSQINPHFLYNTLDSISWMAKRSNQAEIAQMVVSLGRLLRHSLSEKRDIITLGEELDLLDDYLSIQKIRFQEKLQYQCKIEIDRDKVRVLPFILQPLLENSIKYGIEEGKGNLKISLSITSAKDGRIKIRSCDNGSGFPAHILSLFDGSNIIPALSEDSLGLGLRNIYSRLYLFYKGEADFILENPSEGGACVTLVIPGGETVSEEDIR